MRVRGYIQGGDILPILDSSLMDDSGFLARKGSAIFLENLRFSTFIPADRGFQRSGYIQARGEERPVGELDTNFWTIGIGVVQPEGPDNLPNKFMAFNHGFDLSLENYDIARHGTLDTKNQPKVGRRFRRISHSSCVDR